ncbi:TolC family protein [Aureliella helgolandensis]|uniref:Cobalt-zinc-cadmium resistance protein CzcC n=1 Tax=Aureliella helgolandensis TaxID=2527968 RepID=A0A518GBK1_9BACT|nr:TolC family protein [Aureliella helgolandensis]QDV26001.1 Cobalt-zinc-cadmium resistance protein CzcC precursor [Aureliella helgolandensis]
MSPVTKFYAVITCVLLLLYSSGCATRRVGHATNMSLASSDNPSRESTKPTSDSLVTTVSYLGEVENGQANFPESIIVAPNSSFSEIGETQPAMTLRDFESLAYSNNPTIRELAATTQKAAGFRTQVGLRANPIVGYQAVQLADRGTDQHTAFIEQEIITGNKLALNRNVQNEALRSQLFELETQKLRVATDIRVKFYEALAAQRRVELIENFRSVTDKGLELAELRKQALEGSKVDVLQAKVQKNEIDLALQQAQVTFEATWRELAAIAGSPELASGTLLGELPKSEALLDWNGLSATMISASPEYQAAQARISRARANLQRQGVQAIPNITAQLAAGVDNATNSGLINFQIGAPIPVFNKNQGNIAAARAEYCRAVMDAERIQNAIKARLAVVSREFDSSLAAVSKYSQEILPSAQESLELAEVAYKAGETSFVQVLVSRRTYFDSNLQYVLAQSQLAQAKSKVDGYVLTGALDAVIDQSGDDSLRGLTFSQQ